MSNQRIVSLLCSHTVHVVHSSMHQYHHIHVCHAWCECECMMSSIDRVTATLIQPCLIMHEPPSLLSIPSSTQHHQHHHIHLRHTWFQQRHTTLNTHRDTRECMLYLIHPSVCVHVIMFTTNIVVASYTSTTTPTTHHTSLVQISNHEHQSS